MPCPRQEQGTVESGKLADLLILDANPLTDTRNIRKIHRVMKGGVVYDPAQILVKQ
jgi:imidazolonepropionase-like amidohydrolase